MIPTFAPRHCVRLVAFALLMTALFWTPLVAVSASCDTTVAAGKSIQDALDGARAGDTVCLEAGEYTETLTISKSLTLRGAGADATGTIIQAAAERGVESAGRVVLVTGPDVEVTIQSVLIRHGVAEVGAGIAIAHAQVRTEDAAITENQSPTWGGGIGFLGGGSLEMIRSTVSNNASDTDGAGIDAFEADQVTLLDSTVSGNSSGNHNGGGMWVGDEGTRLLIQRSTISGNVGGGIRWSVFEDTREMVVVNSTISGNRNGPGINHTGGPGSTSSLTVLNSTIADNASPVAWLADANVTNTIVTDGCNTALATSGGHNREQGTDTCGFQGPGDMAGLGVHVDLGPLADNGGPTLTHAPGDNSDAIAGGAAEACGYPLVNSEDQRGKQRSTHACSVGAFEVECTFTASPAPEGIILGVVSACRLADLSTFTSIWVTAEGGLVGYVPGAPEWANAAVSALYPHVIPTGTPLIVVQR